MARPTDSLIQDMVAELQPVRSLRMRDGVMLTIAALGATVLAIAMLPGLWKGLWNGEASAFFFTTNGLLVILGCAGTGSVLRMASPRVGNQHEGPRWALLMLAVLPVAALLSLPGYEQPLRALGHHYGLKCLGAGMLASSLTAIALFAWLRRGAPVSPATAGLHLGVASTALGAAAYGLSCPLDGAVHLGIWHVAPVLLGGLIGRLLLPPLLRW